MGSINSAANASTEVRKILQVAMREMQIGNVRRAYAVRMRKLPPRIVIELKALPPDLAISRMREDAAQAAAHDMLAKRTLRYKDMNKLGHASRAVHDGIRILESKGWVERSGRGRTAKWVK